MIFDKESVTQFLPHREPFLFVDSIETIIIPSQFSLDKKPVDMRELIGAKVVGHYRTKKDHPIFKGHFPGNPIFPGVLQIEMMAQVSSFVTSRCTGKNLSDINLEVVLVGSDSSRFRKPIYPEMDLVIKGELVKVRGIFMSFDAKVYCNEELVSESTFLATVQIS